MHIKSLVTLSIFVSAALAHYERSNSISSANAEEHVVSATHHVAKTKTTHDYQPPLTPNSSSGGFYGPSSSSSARYSGASVRSDAVPTSSSNSSNSSSRSSTTTCSISARTTSSSTSSASTTSICSYWMEDIKNQGIAPFASDSKYKVFRNIKTDFGAKGDGVTDDTAAINLAISSGERCAPGTCNSTSTTPALVYFPPGIYIVSQPIIDYYYTQIIGNPNCLPIIKASAGFTARWVIDGDANQTSGALGFGATNVFWRQIRNFVIDMTAVDPILSVAGIHWPTAQATSLQNILFKMSSASNTQHQGVFVESGSGGFMTDLIFQGGFEGMVFANQQFTMRNLTFNNVYNAIRLSFDWGWLFKGLTITNCTVGIDMSTVDTNGAQTVGSVILIDSQVSNTDVAVLSGRNTTSTPPTGGSLIIENVKLNNVPIVVQGPNNVTMVTGTTGTATIAGFGQGHGYTPNGPNIFQGAITPNVRPRSLTSGDNFYERSKPQYEKYPISRFISARDGGAKGDGITDDSDVLQQLFKDAVANGKIVYFDAGDYLVTKTVFIPPGTRIVGEAYPVILASGGFFSSMSNPQPVLQVGRPGDVGNFEWSDMIVSTKGAMAGAVLIEYNLASSTSSPAGIWDVHTRVGGFTGSDLQLADCPKTPTTPITSANLNKNCIAAFLDMHISPTATGLYMENNWLWVSDHDVDDPLLTQITVYAGRGLLIESAIGGIWLYGTAVEHHTLYQYQLVNTTSIFLGFIQTETAYYQPNPDGRIPFAPVAAYSDPVLAADADGWGLRVVNSTEILVYGAGLYSFFDNYNVTCSNQGNGEACQKRIFSVEDSKMALYTLSTVGVTNMITMDEVDVASYADNLNGFVDTVALFRTG